MSGYSSSSQQNNNRLQWKAILVLLLATMVSMGAYLWASAQHVRIGFPLDDAWIHQTYARNLALRGEWAFIPGQPSGGSTSPLWTVLLAGGYLISSSPFIWSFALGGLILAGMAMLVEKGVRTLVEGYSSKIPWAGLIVIFEWHFVWSSVSGMETLFHAVIILAVAILLVRSNPPWLILGLLAGMSVWVRPDGITLVGPILFSAIFVERGRRKIAGAILKTMIGFGILFAPYLLFNFSLTGKLLPTTFYAKQAEYSLSEARSIISQFGDSTLKFLAGTAIILLPGVIVKIISSLRKKAWSHISMLIWMVGYLCIYMLRLPAYQHGRYLIPAMPIFFLFGLGGFLEFIKGKKLDKIIYNLAKVAWAAALSFVCLGFWILGMNSYKADVEFIETEMVDTALWVADHLPGDALVAAHDIGALGYFDHHRLVDLAGLITPEVISFLRDEDQLARYLNEQGVTFLVAFPDWYPTLTTDLIPVFTTGAAYAPSVGETNMTVYEWSGK